MNKPFAFFLLLGVLFLVCSCQNQEKESVQNNNKSTVYPQELKDMFTQLQNTPDSNGLRFRIAVALDSIGDYSNALIQMDSLLHRDSINYGYLFTTGKIYQNAKDTTHAIQYFRKALNIYQDPEGILYLANLLAEKKDPQSIHLVRNVKSMHLSNSDNANCDFIAGVYYARTGDTANAIKSLDMAITEDYTLMPAYIEKGLLYFDHHDYGKALEVFRFASRVNHLYADAYYYMARSHEMMGRKDSAVLRFKQAYSLDHGITEAQAGLKRLSAE